MASASAGVQSSIDVESQPVIPGSSAVSQPYIWSWVWFGLAVCVVLGFHIRLFGTALPPSASFP